MKQQTALEEDPFTGKPVSSNALSGTISFETNTTIGGLRQADTSLNFAPHNPFGPSPQVDYKKEIKEINNERKGSDSHSFPSVTVYDSDEEQQSWDFSGFEGSFIDQTLDNNEF